MARRRGAFALAVAVLLWASFALTIRGLGASGLTPADAAVLRFAIPVLILAPWLPRAVRAVRRERFEVVAALSLAGLPHFLLSAWGGSLTSAALVGLLLPGSVPLFVALILAVRDAKWIGRRRVSAPAPIGRRRLSALGAIVLGIGATATLTTGAAATSGIAVLLTAGCAWAVYTIGLRHTRLDVISVILLVCTPSALLTLTLAGIGALPSTVLDGSAPLSQVALFSVLQGLGTGIVSTASYAYAVRCLGSGIPAVTGALSPVLTTLLAVPLFGEPITAGIVLALALIVGGVLTYQTAPTAVPTTRDMSKTKARPKAQGGPRAQPSTAVASSSTSWPGIARRVTPSIVVAGATPAAPNRPASTP